MAMGLEKMTMTAEIFDAVDDLATTTTTIPITTTATATATTTTPAIRPRRPDPRALAAILPRPPRRLLRIPLPRDARGNHPPLHPLHHPLLRPRSPTTRLLPSPPFHRRRIHQWRNRHRHRHRLHHRNAQKRQRRANRIHLPRQSHDLLLRHVPRTQIRKTHLSRHRQRPLGRLGRIRHRRHRIRHGRPRLWGPQRQVRLARLGLGKSHQGGRERPHLQSDAQRGKIQFRGGAQHLRGVGSSEFESVEDDFRYFGGDHACQDVQGVGILDSVGVLEVPHRVERGV
mmetsp:Transcript_4734/g.9588  ORF Transcript_4734/g.9588 Transcript_4734/m.9588 type:complete len:285 (+) Transcript_4734:554-1408(+)